MKNVIITGITGQDGSYMAEYLLKYTDCYVIGLGRDLPLEKTQNIRHLLGHRRFHVEICDLTDKERVEGLVKLYKPQYLINFAAQSSVWQSWQSPQQTFQVGVVGVMNCLEAIRKYDPDCRFFNAGSSEEFESKSPYASSKAASRKMVELWREAYGLYAVQGILYNHESERRGEQFVSRKISKGVAKIKYNLERGRLPEPMVLGNLDSCRDWSHAEDFVDGIWKMLNVDTPKDYTLCSGISHSIRDMVELAFKVADVPIECDNRYGYPPCIGHNKAQQINYSFRVNDMTLPVVLVSPELYRPKESFPKGDYETAERELKWKRQVKFTELVTRMVENDYKLLTQ